MKAGQYRIVVEFVLEHKNGGVSIALTSFKQKIMGNIRNGESSIPSKFEQIDWIAFEHLQKKRARSKSNFNLEALEFAQDKVMTTFCRQASGQKLAEDLFRDGKKKALLPFSSESRLTKGTLEFLRNQEKQTEPFPSLENNFKLAINIVKQTFALLNEREIIALFLKLTNQISEEETKRFLRVGTRQYRNIISEANSKLKSRYGFTEAFFLIMIHSEENDLISFLKNIIKSQLQVLNAA